jgi:hypothetical protein
MEMQSIVRHFQQYFSYIVAVSFIGGRNPKKTTDLSQVTDKLCHIISFGGVGGWSEPNETNFI